MTQALPPERRDHDDADAPALHPTDRWSFLTYAFPLPFSVRGTLRSLLRPRERPWQEIIRQSALPATVMQTIALIVRKTRLWPSEKSDVARELCAHFADGLAAGAPPDDLCRSFGQPKAVAKLIRAAKRRGRPLWWQTWHYGLKAARYAIVLLMIIYATLAFMFFASSPSIKRNYSAELNAKILATPESSRSWPFFLSALRDLGRVPLELESSLEPPGVKPDPAKHVDIWPQQPGDVRWPQAAAWVNSKHDAVEKIRRAAAMEHLGFPLFDQLPEDYRKFIADRSGTPMEGVRPQEENPSLIGVLLPYLGDFRQMARVLVVDARIATQEHDADRFVADIRAMCGLARQCDEVQSLINKLVQSAILSLAIETIKKPLATDLLDAPHLRDLAHTIALFDDGVLHMPLSLEKQFLEDTVQRSYTDNGSGDGHMTHEGLKLIEGLSGPSPNTREPEERMLLAAGGPLSVAGMASRKELLAEADRLYAMAEEEGSVPLWKRASSRVNAEWDRIESSTMERTRYLVLTLLIPAFSKASQSIEVSRQTRDGVLVAIAVESYRRVHGVYPPTLDALVPALLPAIPPDRYDGSPIKYRLIGDGSTAHPVIYSIGVDRLDDGGGGPKDPRIAANLFHFKTAATMKPLLADPKFYDQYSGDWILYKPE